MLLKRLLGKLRGRGAATSTADGRYIEFPLEIEARCAQVHSRAPVREHLDILYGDLNIADEAFTQLYFRCLEHTGTVVTPFNIFQRFQTRHDLLRYFFATLEVPGARVECGAYRGATALLLCHAWRSRNPRFGGEGLYLLDSFTGTSASTERDFIPVRRGGSVRAEPFFPAGHSDVTPEMVRGFFAEFPQVQICGGWVPDVFRQIDQQQFAFVHVDLTLYEATLAALEFFYPRLARGGVILCDGSIFCPGVAQAVEQFTQKSNAAYIALGHRQFVFLSTRS